MRGGRVGSLAASPTLVGRGHGARRGGRGLPRLPGELAGCPSSPPTSSPPSSRTPTLVPGNEVRIGGIRVGQIKSVEPVRSTTLPARTTRHAVHEPRRQDRHEAQPGPRAAARGLDGRRPLPSALGLKYLQINRGDSSQGFEPGSTMPVSAARPEPVEIDQVFNMFDARPERRSRQPARVRQRARRARRGPERRDRTAEAARGAAHAGDAQPRLADDRPLELRLLAVGDRGRGRPGRADPGTAVRRPRYDLRRPCPSLSALHPGDDLQSAGCGGHGDRGAARR